MKLAFDYMEGNEVLAHVRVNREKVDVNVVSDSIVVQLWYEGRRKTIKDIYELLESRCFDRGRPDRGRLLKLLGLEEYDPIAITKVTKGFMVADNLWIRYDGDTTDYYEFRKKLLKGTGIG